MFLSRFFSRIINCILNVLNIAVFVIRDRFAKKPTRASLFLCNKVLSYLTVRPTVHLTVHPTVHLTVHPTVHLTVHPTVHLTAHPSGGGKESRPRGGHQVQGGSEGGGGTRTGPQFSETHILPVSTPDIAQLGSAL